MAAEIRLPAGYHGRSVTAEQPPADAPVDPLYSHAASPFIRTEVATPAGIAQVELPTAPIAALSSHRNQIYFGLAILAYLMVLVGCVTAIEANASAGWRFYVAALPLVPGGLVVWLFVRALSRMDEVQKRMQVQAIGFSMGATALITFAYGFLESVGLPDMNLGLVLPGMVLFWGMALIFLDLKYRLRR